MNARRTPLMSIALLIPIALGLTQRPSSAPGAAVTPTSGVTVGGFPPTVTSVIVTDAVFGSATPLMEETRKKAAAVIQPLLDAGILPIVTGFNGATIDERPTTLGRGGSDFSGSILAAVLDAAEPASGQPGRLQQEEGG